MARRAVRRPGARQIFDFSGTWGGRVANYFPYWIFPRPKMGQTVSTIPPRTP